MFGDGFAQHASYYFRPMPCRATAGFSDQPDTAQGQFLGSFQGTSGATMIAHEQMDRTKRDPPRANELFFWHREKQVMSGMARSRERRCREDSRRCPAQAPIPLIIEGHRSRLREGPDSHSFQHQNLDFLNCPFRAISRCYYIRRIRCIYLDTGAGNG